MDKQINPLHQLLSFGQSYWMDNLTRKMIKDGSLRKRVQEEGLRGITSNPSIFQKAISGSNDYDEQILELTAKQLKTSNIYEQLAIKDVQDACDILKPIHDSSNQTDGFVSLEVSPHLAHKTQETMDEARRLYRAVNRSNCFIKIPGTREGVSAIEQMLYEGIPINITLLFSLPSYEAVIEAYLKALERRANENKTISEIRSVASFFLSRIDVLVDKQLGSKIRLSHFDQKEKVPEIFLGKTAIAHAKIAYRSFRKAFSSPRWKKLSEKGAQFQKPLWASTGTKNPIYSDVYYIEPLIAPDTVTTLPEATIDAFKDHGNVKENSILEDIDMAYEIVNDLKNQEIDLEQTNEQLVKEGVQKFIDPYDRLLKEIEEKQQKLCQV